VEKSENIHYCYFDGNSVAIGDKILKDCSKLYSENYGVWSKKSKNAGSRVKLSEVAIKKWLNNSNTAIYCAFDNKELVGYAIALSIEEIEYGRITWITQLVVHENYRNQGIAKNILLSVWGFSDHKAWGIVSANPYAVRALEKVTRRRALPERIKRDIKELRNVGIKNVCFIKNDTEFVVDENNSKVNTEFFVDHEDVRDKLYNVTKEDVAWLLGDIDDGWEWVAFTFQDQIQIPLNKDEINRFLDTSDAIVKEAYSRMSFNSSSQKWAKNEDSEIQYLKSKIDFDKIQFAYDLGCGTGRHSLVLAKNNISVIGVDYLQSNIDQAQKNNFNNVSFVCDDCRTYRNDQKASLVLCLYDVIGTFASKEENAKIIATAFDLLCIDGYAVFSVMNYEMIANYAEHKFKFSENANEILNLKPSNTMEKTGNVFLPEYCLVDEETHIVYRKEQFLEKNKIPKELIVRDMRFTKLEIVEMCKKCGFSIVEAKFVNASDWNVSYDSTDKRAKEILVICKKNCA
jgi:SAM-dependent methyltransferase/GNAT superfamily N-acetyltransferase